MFLNILKRFKGLEKIKNKKLDKMKKISTFAVPTKRGNVTGGCRERITRLKRWNEGIETGTLRPAEMRTNHCNI